MSEPSDMDKEFYEMARAHIAAFTSRVLYQHPAAQRHTILEIGPTHPGPRPDGWDTLDIKPGCTYQADITYSAVMYGTIPYGKLYDTVLAMEVLEHTIDPVSALSNIRRITKDGGLLLASAPWNFRAHNPLPDLHRFNQNSWRLLLKDWDILEMDVLETPGRPLMPLHINVLARCNKSKSVDPRTMKWEPIP